MIERYPDWPSRLNAYLTDIQKNVPLEGLDYGTFDCCIFIADGFVEMTGIDLFKDYRKRYATKIGAARVLRKMGGMKQALTDVVGGPIHAALAKQGDFAYLDGSCGFVCGRNSLFLSDAGFTFFPTINIECAFRG